MCQESLEIGNSKIKIQTLVLRLPTTLDGKETN